jgi:hypothetical protein
VAEASDCLRRLNPRFDSSWILASHVARYEFAQTICAPNFFARLPEMTSSVDGFFMADTAYYYPEDRSISESLRVGRQLARAVGSCADGR